MSNATDCEYDTVNVRVTGPLLLGYQFNWALYGVLCAQVYVYNQSSKVDSWPVKSIVYGLLLLETVQSILSTHDAFHQLVYSWGDEEGLGGLYYTWFDLPIITGFISTVTQCFYGWRIYALSRSKTLVAIIVLLSLMQCGAAFAEGARTKIIDADQLLSIPKNTFSATTVWLSGSVACDIIISAAMAHSLSKTRFGFAKIDAALSSMVRLVIETGMATSACAVVELAMFLGYKDTTYYVTPALVLSKLYSNSLLVLLNNHIPLRHDISANSAEVPARLARNIFQGSGAIQLSMNQERGYNEEVSMIDLSQKRQTESQGTDVKAIVADI